LRKMELSGGKKNREVGNDMSIELLNYLFADLKEHMEKLKDEAYTESPDGDRISYHFDKSLGIIAMIEAGTGKKFLESSEVS
jgi:hypothetical protein